MKALLTICFLFIGFVCCAQTDPIKLYAFKQTSLSGLPTTQEDTTAQQKAKVSVTYLIYLSQDAEKNFEPVEVWINGEVFEVAKQNIVETPIEYTYEDNSYQPQKMLLVPATTNQVWQLKPIEKLRGKFSLPKKNLAQTNELIVVYKEGKKLNSALMKKIKNLPIALRQ